VVLDVVFNHLGPTGDHVVDPFGPFLSERHRTAWGAGVNVDGPGSDLVRETIFQVAQWWVGEIGVDGLRVDACHGDRRPERPPRAGRAHRSGARGPPRRPPDRRERPQRPTDRAARSAGGWGFDADWADDFHHSLVSLLRDDDRAWLADFGRLADLAKAFHRPYVHDGTWSSSAPEVRRTGR